MRLRLLSARCRDNCRREQIYAILREKAEEGGIIKAILLRSERRRRLRGAKNERQNFLIGRP